MQESLAASPAAPTADPTAAPTTGDGFEITHGPSCAMLRVDLSPGQSVVAEAGSMVARHQAVEMEVKLNASPSTGFIEKLIALFVAFIRRILGGETFFVNEFSTAQPGSVWISPVTLGQVTHRRMQGETLVLSAGAYLAHRGDLNMKLRFGGLRGILSKEGAFFLELSGHGDLWFNSYGGVHAIDVNGSYIVDNGHLVGFEGSLDFDITSAGGGVMGLMASGEGLVCNFKGQGRIYIQSRNTSSLLSWITPHLPH